MWRFKNISKTFSIFQDIIFSSPGISFSILELIKAFELKLLMKLNVQFSFKFHIVRMSWKVCKLVLPFSCHQFFEKNFLDLLSVSLLIIESWILLVIHFYLLNFIIKIFGVNHCWNSSVLCHNKCVF